MEDLTTYLRETWPVQGVGPITQAQRGRIHEAAARIEALETTLRQIADSGDGSINAHLAAQALETEHGNG